MWVGPAAHKTTCANPAQLNQPVPSCLCTFPKITRLRNNRKTKINSRSCHHISLTTSFPTSQEFCNSNSIWEKYANFSESLQSSKMPKILSSTKFHTFLQELRNNKEILIDEQMKCLIFYLYRSWSIYSHFSPTCSSFNSKLIEFF